MAVDWSPDGRLVAGMLQTRTDERSGITLFDLEEDAYIRLTMDFGQLPEWTPDGRRLIFQGRPPLDTANRDYPQDEGLVIVDLATRQTRGLMARAGATLDVPQSFSGWTLGLLRAGHDQGRHLDAAYRRQALSQEDAFLTLLETPLRNS